MTLDDAVTRLAGVLRAENDHLAAGNAQEAAALVAEKEAAVQAVRAALPGGTVDAGAAARLRGLAKENAERLTQAIAVQSRVLEMVARASRRADPVARYGARGAAAPGPGARALATRC